MPLPANERTSTPLSGLPRELLTSCLMIGLGGGSLAKFCHHYLPETRITVVEINPHVIAMRRHFQVPDDDAHWRWHVGLDAQASRLLDQLWRDEGLSPDEHRRLLLLMRLDFERLSDQQADVAGKPVYLALAADEDGLLRMKPQNLLFNLPLARQ